MLQVWFEVYELAYGDIVVVVASVASSSSLSDSALTKPADTMCTFFLQPSLDRYSL